MILYYFTYMKQASFKIGERTSFERTNFERTSSTDETTSSTDKSDQNNITSKKPIKYVENIYYFK